METFVVQVWVPTDDRSYGGGLRGLVRHVASGRETPFRDGDEVLALLRLAVNPPLTPPPTCDGGPRSGSRE